MHPWKRSGIVILLAFFFAASALATPPTAAFTADQTTGLGALTVWFSDTSDPGTTPITSWQWDFGDGSVDDPLATIQHPAHYYEYPGIYTVSLTVTSSEGVATVTQTDYITVAVAPIFRVDIDNTSGIEDGLSWNTAFNTIQEGVDAASAVGGGEIWVAEGVYTSISNPVVTVKQNTAVFGGFCGNEIDRNTRDPKNIISTIHGSNSRRCIIAQTQTLLDGLSIKNGLASNGAGILAKGKTTINMCTITNNTANTSNRYGAGIEGSKSLLVLKTIFSYNIAGANLLTGNSYGGAIYIAEYIVDSQFESNECRGSGTQDGGAIHTAKAAINCTFFSCKAASNSGNAHGGATYKVDNTIGCLYNYNLTQGYYGSIGGGASYLSNTIHNCVFSNNYIAAAVNCYGGGAYTNGSVINCTFFNNTTGEKGRAGALYGSDATVINCVFWGSGVGNGYPTVDGTFLNISNCASDVNLIGNELIRLREQPWFKDINTNNYGLFPGFPCIDMGLNLLPSDIAGIMRPQGRKSDIGAYEFSNNSDLDNDGLPDDFELDQGCNRDIRDAQLGIQIDLPGNETHTRSSSIQVSGKYSIGSSQAGISLLYLPNWNNYRTWEQITSVSNNTWSYTLNFPAPGEYIIGARLFNKFGGYCDAHTIKIYYQPEAPVVNFTYPLFNSYINGAVNITGAASSGAAGFGTYTLEYVSGADPETLGPWTHLHSSPSPVTNNVLGTWNVLALPEGWYVLRLRADDGAGTESKTWVTVYVSHDAIAPAAPSLLSIAGAIQPELVRNNGSIKVMGQGDGDCYLHLAELISESGAVVKNVTTELTLHFSGALRGTCVMPGSTTAKQVALRVQYKDFAGNIGPAAASNYITVENSPPVISIDYLPNNTLLFLDAGNPETYTIRGTASDTGDSGVNLVEIKINTGAWTAATGTESWNWEWTPTAAGTYSIQARATDYQGNISTTATISVTVSLDKPTAHISLPKAGTTFFSGSVVDIIGSAKDPVDFQDYQVQYRVAGAPVWAPITLMPVTTPVHEGLLAQWDTVGLDSPNYELQVVVRDTAANISTHTIVVGIMADLSMFGLPDASFYEGTQLFRYAYLPNYVVPGDDAASYTYALVPPLPPVGMGVSIDAENWLHIMPVQYWNGWADITVRVEDNNGNIAHDTLRVVVLNVNDPPSAPTLTLTPTQPGDNDELLCKVTTHSTDPDGNAFLYYFDWYRSSDGIHYGSSQRSLTQPANFIIFNKDGLSSLLTIPGEYWRCVVRAYDGAAFSAPTSVAVRIFQESAITASVAPVSLTLGQSITLSGRISNLNGIAPVGFTSVSPAGLTDSLYPEGTVCNESGDYLKTFHPREATEGRNFWQVRAAWPGDAAHKGAASDAVSFNVAKAQPELTLRTTHASALMMLQGAETFAVDAAFYVPGFPSEPALLALYDGVPIRLSIQTPDGQTPYAPLIKTTAGAGRVSFTKADFDAAGVVFSQAGAWRFKADFLGNHNFRSTATTDFDLTDARLSIKAGAGYAIIALGRLDEAAEGHAEHAQTADFVYATLRTRGFAAEDIAYLRAVLPGETCPVPPTSLLPPSPASLRHAIEVWARDKMLGSPAPLYLILIDHGSPGIFHLDVGGTGVSESVSAPEINQWLTLLESSLRHKALEYGAYQVQQNMQWLQSIFPLIGTGDTQSSDVRFTPQPTLFCQEKNAKAASEQPILIMYGACYSGSFIPVLSKSGRILITSAAAHEISYRGVLNQDSGIRDGEFFLMELFRNLGAGRTMKDGFELASLKTYDYTNTRSNGGVGDVPQHPLLDDNGDGKGTAGLLSIALGQDGALVSGMDLGLGSNAGANISWFSATPPRFVNSGDTIGEVMAQTTGRTPHPGDRAWLEIKAPDYNNGQVATPGYEAFQRVAAMAGPIEPTELRDLGAGGFAYVWNQTSLENHDNFSGFEHPGTYKLYYFLRDGFTGQVGAYLITNIYVARTGNTPPTPVSLVYPADGATVFTRPLFAWNAAADPDGDTITYHLQVSANPAFSEDSTAIFTTESTSYQLDELHALQDLTQYYWRVIPVDNYGAQPDAHQVRSLYTNNSNPMVPGAIQGVVRNVNSLAPVANAVIRVLPTNVTAISSANGQYFLGNLQQGVYALEVNATGYATTFASDAMVQSGRFTTKDILLNYSGNNRPPVIRPVGNQEVLLGERLEIQCSASDPDTSDSLTWSVMNAPPRMTIDPQTGVLVYAPIDGDEGHYAIIIQVTDNGIPPFFATDILVVSALRVNHTPILLPVGNQTATTGKRLSIQCQASDDDSGDLHTWSLINAPPRMTIHSGTGLIVYEPINGDEGTYSVTVMVTDNGVPPRNAQETITITVVLGAYISGPSHAAVGDRVVLIFHSEWRPDPWYMQWRHNGDVIPDQNNEEFIIESATLDDAGWYEASQISEDKGDVVSAAFYLTVMEAMPLKGWAALAAAGLLAAVFIRATEHAWRSRQRTGRRGASVR